MTHTKLYTVYYSPHPYRISEINSIMDNMQDILKNYYAAGGKTLFEAPYLDKNYIPVDIDDIITYHNDDKGMFVSQNFPVIDPYKIQKLTKGATPVVKLDDGYYTFSSEDDKTVHVQLVMRARGPGQTNQYVPQLLTKEKMSIDDFINKASEVNE